MYKVGVIGNGFVGSAIASAFALHAKVFVYDVDPRRRIDSFADVMKCEFIFVSVPTPMNVSDSNKIDLSIVEKAFRRISENATRDQIVILKSTVAPGTTKLLLEKFPNLQIVFNPEFLTERKAKFDFLNQSRVVLGGDYKNIQKVIGLYVERFKHCNFCDIFQLQIYFYTWITRNSNLIIFVVRFLKLLRY